MYSLIMLNGGVGARVGADLPKQFVRVNNVPTLVYALIAVDPIEAVTQIVINHPEGWREALEKLVSDYAIQTPMTYVGAGATRHESVRKMLPHCENEHVLIHESARPLVDRHDFEQLIADPNDNVAYMAPIPFTVAPVEPVSRRVTGYLDRDTLRNVQLPQKFRLTTLAAAHEYAERESLTFTEDATLCAVAGHEVHFIDGSDRNFKVTTKTDVRLAGFLLGGDDQHDL